MASEGKSRLGAEPEETNKHFTAATEITTIMGSSFHKSTRHVTFNDVKKGNSAS